MYVSTNAFDSILHIFHVFFFGCLQMDIRDYKYTGPLLPPKSKFSTDDDDETAGKSEDVSPVTGEECDLMLHYHLLGHCYRTD